MEMLRFQSNYFQLKNVSPVFWKKFLFFRKFVLKSKYWKRSKFPVIVTQKHADASSRGLFWKSLVPFFRTICVLSAGFKMKPLRQ